MPHGNKAYVVMQNLTGLEVLGGPAVNVAGNVVVLDPDNNILIGLPDNLVGFGAVNYGDSNHDIQASMTADIIARAAAQFSVTVSDVEFVGGG